MGNDLICVHSGTLGVLDMNHFDVCFKSDQSVKFATFYCILHFQVTARHEASGLDQISVALRSHKFHVDNLTSP